MADETNPKIPEIVRQRLASQPMSEHPDGDLLTALAEHRLVGGERDQVLAHLAACSECREIVALAAPSVTEMQPMMTTASRRAWWTWSTLQWGAAAAAVTAVAFGLLVLKPSQRTEVAKTSVEQKQVAQQQPMAQQPTTQRSEETRLLGRPAAESKTSRDQKQDAFAVAAAESSAKKKNAEPENAYGFVDREQPKTEALKDSDAALAKKAPAADSKTGAAVGGIVSAGGGRFNAPANAAPANAPAQNASTAMNETVAVTSASEAVQVAKPTSPATAQTRPATVAAAKRAAPPPAKENPLQRNSGSLAADELAVGASGAAVETQRANMSFATLRTNRPWRINDGRLQRFDATRNSWDDVSVGTASRLALVVNLGTEVWVGGADGAMFYSNDQGAHWVPTATGGWSKDATITAMTPTALRSVEIHLSNGERWRSADGGASWTKYH